MNKIQSAYKYFDENNNLEKEELIKKVMKKLSITSTTATQYYYKWKKKFTGSNNCVPKKEPTLQVKKQKERAKFIFNEEAIKAKEVKEGCINQSIDEATKTNLKILTAKIQGEYGDYELTPEGVRVGEEVFRNEEDIENYRKREIRAFYLRLGEIVEILNLGV